MKPLHKANISLVYIKNGTPHCKKHGAMNAVAKYRDGSLVWRCITTSRYDPRDRHLPHEQRRIIENNCRAGCIT